MSDTGNHEAEQFEESLQHHIPICDDQFKPFVGRSFESFDAAIMFYKQYAERCGFDIRMGSKHKCKRDGQIVRQYVYCNREGYKNPVPDDVNVSSTKVKRRRASFRVGCNAQIIIKFDSVQGCVVHRFEEQHTHQLIPVEFRRYMKVNRNLGIVEKNFMMNCARVNIGPTKAYRFYKETIGNYTDVGSIAVDWKNHTRDRKAFVHGCDAQLIIQKMALKKASCQAFFHDYAVDEHDQLTCLFWADPIARRNCSVFGDVVSFDCTYGTNKYNMIFAPFTGKDNHGKIVTFAGALLSGEDNKMYAWVFEKFKECMRRSPLLFITDQDPAIKIAVQAVFPDSNHRLCMWHIMMKVPEKTPVHLKKDDEFKKQLNAIIWSDMIDANEFEQRWNEIITEFGLLGDKWFDSIYDIRQHWIPAYFRDIPMSGVCRTTSISESVNAFFGHFLSNGSNLVEFLMHYESAIDAQRQANDRLNSLDNTSEYLFKTPLPIEKQAATIYTKNQFFKVQDEIEMGCITCRSKSTEEQDAVTIYEVDDGCSGLVKVTHDKNGDNFDCSCKKFTRDGFLCCHIFWVFKDLKLNVIPEKYIVHRWTKKAYENPMSDMGDVSLNTCVLFDEKKKRVDKMISYFFACLGAVEGDEAKSTILMDKLSDLRDLFVSGDGESTSSNLNTTLFETYYGMEKPAQIDIHDPPPVKTKGSGSRLKSKREAAIKRAEKPKRMCRRCNKLSNHDSRNCTSQL